MQTRDAHPPFAYPAGFGAPWRRLGVAGRAARTLGIEWADSFEQGLDDRGVTAKVLAATRNPAEILAIQSAYLQRAGERWAARSTATADQIAALAGDLLRPPPAPSPAPAHERGGGRAPDASSAGRTSARRRLAKSAHRL
jgi:hypothetical protein